LLDSRATESYVKMTGKKGTKITAPASNPSKLDRLMRNAGPNDPIYSGGLTMSFVPGSKRPSKSSPKAKGGPDPTATLPASTSALPDSTESLDQTLDRVSRKILGE
jgi:hypothetical protein